VADDELSAPLGQNVKQKRRRFSIPIRVPHLIAGALGLFLFACAVWTVAVDDPLGGEPVAVVATGFDAKPAPTMPIAVSGGGAAQGARSYDGPGTPAPKQIQVPTQVPGEPQVISPSPNIKTVTIIDGSTGKRQEVPISTSRDTRAPLEQRLLESTRHGAIPRIAPDGARPSEVYARAAMPLQGKKKDGPKVAIVVGGLGISATATQQALKKLPADHA
jgi:hypothetical protein